jgi:hypothetical protein
VLFGLLGSPICGAFLPQALGLLGMLGIHLTWLAFRYERTNEE